MGYEYHNIQTVHFWCSKGLYQELNFVFLCHKFFYRAKLTQNELPQMFQGMQEKGILARANETREGEMERECHLRTITRLCRVNAENSTVPVHLKDLFEKNIKNLDADQKLELF